MKSLDLFLPRLLPAVVGCPTPLAVQSLLDAAIDFCEETRVIQATVEPINTQAGNGQYELDVPTQQRIVSVLQVWYGTTSLTPAPTHIVDTPLAYVATVAGEAAPRSTPSTFYAFEPGIIGIYPTPDAATLLPISARIAVKPLRDATTVADELYNDWLDSIVAGAIARIVAIPNQPYSGDPLAAQIKFRSGVSRATHESKRGRVNASMSIAPRPFI